MYESDFAVTHKDDRSPLTEADLAAHRVIVAAPGRTRRRRCPCCRRNPRTSRGRSGASGRRYWLVDPLDGTREFVKRNGEFTVNIALIEHGEPVLGVVHAPVRGELAHAARGLGASMERPGAAPRELVAQPAARAAPLRVAGSRSHGDPRMGGFLERVGEHELVSLGSSLKFLLLADGSADVYLRFGPTSEWDTAAGQAVLEAAGGGSPTSRWRGCATTPRIRCSIPTSSRSPIRPSTSRRLLLRHPVSAIEPLLSIMARLRDRERRLPVGPASRTSPRIAPYTIEEAYEVADAIDRGDLAGLKDELGDLLFQVVFHARMAEEAGHFAFGDVVAAICDKMVRRHPHVFGDAVVADAAAQTVAWEEAKKRERGAEGGDASALAGVARGLPEWQRALKLQQARRRRRLRLARRGSGAGQAARGDRGGARRVQGAGARPRRGSTDEIGDVLFVCVNLARHAGVDLGTALRHANAKFERRFRRMEALAAADGTGLSRRVAGRTGASTGSGPRRRNASHVEASRRHAHNRLKESPP